MGSCAESNANPADFLSTFFFAFSPANTLYMHIYSNLYYLIYVLHFAFDALFLCCKSLCMNLFLNVSFVHFFFHFVCMLYWEMQTLVDAGLLGTQHFSYNAAFLHCAECTSSHSVHQMWQKYRLGKISQTIISDAHNIAVFIQGISIRTLKHILFFLLLKKIQKPDNVWLMLNSQNRKWLSHCQ